MDILNSEESKVPFPRVVTVSWADTESPVIMLVWIITLLHGSVSHPLDAKKIPTNSCLKAYLMTGH